MADLPAALAALDDAVGAASDLLDETTSRRLARRVDEVARRRGFLGPTVVAVLAGGTGSGKSSLLNVLAAEEVVEVGVLRPTTEAPAAWVPEGADPSLLALLDDLGIERRVGGNRDATFALVDLPDLDSLELAHHATVDALLPRADLIVWVLDPLKYNDRSLHGRIAARSDYARQSLFVLNQIDRLEHGQLQEVAADLRASLRNDGIEDPDVILTAADPPGDAPRGVEVLQQRLADRARDKRLVVDQLTVTLRSVADQLDDAVSVSGGEVGDLEERWEEARDTASEVTARSIIDDVAVARAEHAAARLASSVGSGPLGRSWHALRRSLVGRAIGLPGDEPFQTELLEAPDRRQATDQAELLLHRAITAVSTAVGGEGGRRLRSELDADATSHELAGAIVAGQELTSAGLSNPATPIPRRRWWVAAGVLQTLLTLAILVGLGWWWIDPGAVAPGQVPWPAVLVAGGAGITIVVSRLVRTSGRGVGRSFVLQRRETLAAAIGGALEERIGARVRAPLEARSHVEERLRDARRAL